MITKMLLIILLLSLIALFIMKVILPNTNIKGFDYIKLKSFANGLSETLAFMIGGLFILMIVIFSNVYSYDKAVETIQYQRDYVNELNEEVDAIVKSFMEHEEITFDRNVSLESLVITYPELRSVELVNNQLETLKEQKDKLHELEVQIIKHNTFKKWFYIR